MKDFEINVSNAELVSTTAGKIEGKSVLILTLRMDPKKPFATQNIVLTGKQARRLQHDVNYMFEQVGMLNDVPKLDENEEMLPQVKDLTKKPKKKK